MSDRISIIIPSLPRCPTCAGEAHVLTFLPVVRQVDGQTPEGPTVYEERVLTEFSWGCSNGHGFATAMPDLELHNWRRADKPQAWRPGSNV